MINSEELYKDDVTRHPFRDLFNFLAKSFCFHKWEQIRTGERIEVFMGISLTYNQYGMRGCRKCGTVQQYIKDDYGDDYLWKSLDEKQMEIIKEKQMW